MDRRKFLGWVGLGAAGAVAATVLPVPDSKPLRNPDFSRRAFSSSEGTASMMISVASPSLFDENDIVSIAGQDGAYRLFGGRLYKLSYRPIKLRARKGWGTESDLP